MSHDIEITKNNSSTILATAGKYCDRNIKVTVNVDAESIRQEGYNEGFDTGKVQGEQAEYDKFWNAYQANGTRTDYKYAFYGVGWTDDTYNPKHPVKPTNAGFMYAYSNITGHIDIDTAQCTTISAMFSNAKKITSIGVIDTRGSIEVTGTFGYMDQLVTIEKLILKSDGSQTISASCFDWDYRLQNIIIEGIIGKTLDMKRCQLLTKDSVMSIVNALSTNTSGLTLSLHTMVKSKFTDAEWATLIATKPNWTISLV